MKFFQNKQLDLDDRLVEIAEEFAKKVDDKTIIELIEHTRKLVSQDPNLLRMSATWGGVIAHLREGHNPKEQQAFFKYLFEQAKFPNSEKLSQYFVELMQINWFNPAKKPDRKTLQSYVDYLVKTFEIESYEVDGQIRLRKLEPFRIIENDWDEVYSVNRNTIWEIESYVWKGWKEMKGDIEESGRKKMLDPIYEIIGDIILTSSPHLANTARAFSSAAASKSAEWILMEDLLKKRGYKDNLFSPLIEMYKLGAWPIGLVGEVVDRKTWRSSYRFVVFIPPVSKKS